MDLLQAADWMYPVPTHYGPGRASEIARLCTHHGMRRPLLVTDRGSRDLPFMTTLRAALSASGLGDAMFFDVSPNPRDDEIAAGVARFRAGDHDGVVGAGGGSGMDAAKAICLSALHDIELLDFDILKPPPEVRAEVPFPTLITIPTTAGTGAESEATAMITETGRLMKWCIGHPRLKVAATLLDPELTVGLPRDLTAWTGCDAWIHAVEAWCVPAFYPLCDGAALEGLRLVGTHLETVVEQPGNIEARGAMLVGSYLAGIAFLKGLGLVHAISHMVGAEYDTHHGLTNAITLPAVLRFNEPAIAARVGPMAQALSLDGTDFAAFYAHTCGLLDRLEIPKNLTAIGVPADCASAMAAKAMRDGAFETNPRRATEAELRTLVEQALSAGR